MSAWIGPPGGLVEILKSKGGLSVSPERKLSMQTTLGGRVKVQRAPRARREWKASTPYASASGASGFLALVEAGTPPWMWVDPYAQVTNLFTPDQSTLLPGAWESVSGVVEGGAVTVDGSFVPRSVLHPSGGGVTFGFRHGVPDRPPVVPGVPVSASVYVRGAGDFSMHWHDWQGASIGSTTQSYNNSTMARVALPNRTPPAGAVSVRIFVTGLLQAAMPCFTWTPDTPAWSIGRGCTQAIVSGLSETTEQAHLFEQGRRYASLSFTVQEVG